MSLGRRLRFRVEVEEAEAGVEVASFEEELNRVGVEGEEDVWGKIEGSFGEVGYARDVSGR